MNDGCSGVDLSPLINDLDPYLYWHRPNNFLNILKGLDGRGHFLTKWEEEFRVKFEGNVSNFSFISL